jgi:hypothetical protein
MPMMKIEQQKASSVGFLALSHFLFSTILMAD